MIIKLLSEDPLHWLNVGISVVLTISEMPHIPICLDSGPASVQIWGRLTDQLSHPLNSSILCIVIRQPGLPKARSPWSRQVAHVRRISCKIPRKCHLVGSSFDIFVFNLLLINWWFCSHVGCKSKVTRSSCQVAEDPGGLVWAAAAARDRECTRLPVSTVTT